MQLLPFRVLDGFSEENPWSRFFGGIALRRLGKMDGGYLAALQLSCIPALLFITTVSAIRAGWIPPHLDEKIGLICSGYAHLAILIFSMLSAPVGAAVRARMDRSPLLQGCALTPLDWSQYVAALHARVFACSVAGGILMAILLIPFAWMLSWDTFDRSVVVGGTFTNMLLSKIDPRAAGWDPSPYKIALAGATIVAAATNFAAGIYLRASILASIPQKAPWSQWIGGFVTLALNTVLCLSVAARIQFATYSGAAYANGKAADWTILVPLAAMEGSLAIVRISIAVPFWWNTASRFEQETFKFASHGS